MAARGGRRRTDEGEHRYNLRSYDRGEELDYEELRRRTRRYVSPPPSSSTRYRARLMKGEGAGGGKRRRDEGYDELEDYHVHPLDSFDRYMLSKLDRDNAMRRREHIRPAREVERLSQRGRAGKRRRPDYSEEEEEEEDRYGEERRGAYRPEERRGRQMQRRRDSLDRHVRFEGYDDRYDRGGRDEEDYGEEEEEEERIMSAPEELDEDEEFLTNYRMPIRRRADYYSRHPERRHDLGRKRRRRDELEEEEEEGEGEDQGLVFTVEEEDQDEGIGRRVAKRYERDHGQPAEERRRREVHRHPKYEDMIAEALVNVGKNGKASGVAIFRYIHDHFDMPANDRLVRNHLHQAFERMINEGRLRHKKASYVAPKKVLDELSAKYGKKEEGEAGKEGEEGEEGEEKGEGEGGGEEEEQESQDKSEAAEGKQSAGASAQKKKTKKTKKTKEGTSEQKDESAKGGKA